MDAEDDDPMRYDYWIEEALRSVIVRALRFAAERGLSDDHHFYVSFRTDTQDVVMPDYLRAQHPGEMTIVLQHQFDDLAVSDDGFSVTLKFGGKPERLYVPLVDVTGFTDPSVNFGLQLNATDLDFEGDEDVMEGGGPFDLPADEEEPRDIAFGGGNDDVASDEDDDEAKTGEVIALDAFRKK